MFFIYTYNKNCIRTLFGHLMQFIFRKLLTIHFYFLPAFGILPNALVFACVSAHTLVQKEKTDRDYEEDYRTDCKGDENAVHALNKEIVERS